MPKFPLVVVAAAVLLLCAPAFAVDGVVLINQASVQAAGGFPFKITQPGSYKLSGNLVVSAVNVDGIDIEANNVTLDLNGFSITGPIKCTAGTLASPAPLSCSLSGTFSTGVFGSPSGNVNIAVRNGSVSGFFDAVFLLSTNASQGSVELVEAVRASSNSGNGIEIDAGIVKRCTSTLNLGDGINAPFSTVTDSVSMFNAGVGLDMFEGAFGGNVFLSNGRGPLNVGASVSRNDNNCDGRSC